jgi:hypothetical protein
VKEFMATLPLEELPGVGWTLRDKLHQNGLYNCADLQSISRVWISPHTCSLTVIKYALGSSCYDADSHASEADVEVYKLYRWLCKRLTGKRLALCCGHLLTVLTTGKCNLLRY